MMQILEKLPGITVERYTLMEKSSAFTGNDSKKLITSQDRPLLSLPPRQHKPRHQPVCVKRNPVSISRDKYAEDKRENLLSYRTSSRGEINPPPRPTSSQCTNKNSHNYVTALLSGESAASEDGEVFTPKPPRAMPKSILKRTGSGVSNRSSRSLGVMSLDSGMARLTDSLLAGKKKRGTKQFIPTESKVFNEIAKKHAMNQVIKMNGGKTKLPEVEGTHTNLPFLGHTNRTTISFYAQNGDYDNSLPSAVSPLSGERVTTVSPSKSVSFKLDHEKPRRQADKNVGRKKKGDAKWEVVLSSKQRQVSDRLSAADRQEIALKREMYSHSSTGDHNNNNAYVFGRTSLYSGFGRHCPPLPEQERKSTKVYVDNAHPSSALLRPRPDGGITGVTGIQLLADPYKRFLLTRSTDPTRGHGKLNSQSQNRLVKSENGDIRITKHKYK